jgi:hypothetical protein
MNVQGNKGEMVIYQTEDGQASLEVKLIEETVWLNLNQMAELFKRDKSVISRHVSNIFKTEELSREATVAKYATVQMEGGRRITRNIEHYNLDVMISVGYRVNSLRGTQFRIWANKILKDYLVKGYTLNEKRLQSQIEKYEALKQSIKLIDNIIDRKMLSTSESEGLLKVIGDFSYALDTLDRYDYGKLELAHISDRTAKRISYEEANRLLTAKISTPVSKKKQRIFFISL